jgi:hypothetical protein
MSEKIRSSKNTCSNKDTGAVLEDLTDGKKISFSLFLCTPLTHSP